ncbi:MAG TPA: NAD(P)-dependent oxidoreductase [Vicinamibacteria bacterium]
MTTETRRPATTFRIFATTDIGPQALQRLRDKGWQLEVYDKVEPPPKSLILEKVRSGIDALITTLRDPIDGEVFAAGKAAGLKIVAQDAVGFDNIDRAAANEHRIPFSHTADVLTDATAEFAFLIMGAVARMTWPSEQMVREQTWSTWHPYHPWLGDEVTGRTVAVIGTGRIGKSFIKKAVGFDMDVLCYDPVFQDQRHVAGVQRVMDARLAEGLTKRQQRIAYVPFEQALREADFVSLHVPLTRPGEAEEPTFHLMDERRLRLMKPTAYLVNTSRGPIVDENALSRALLEGWIAGAALDVFEKEPLPADSPLRDERLKLKLRMFHHFASAARATRLSPDPDVGMAGRTVQAVIDVLEDRYPNPGAGPYVVNKEAFAEGR